MNNNLYKGNMNVRSMSRDDIASILTIDKTIGRGVSSINASDLLSSDLESPLNFSFVCEVDNRIVGFVLANLNYQGVPFTEICLIHGVGVDPAYQHRGVGSRLIRELLNHCMDEQVARVRAPIDSDDVQLRRFFQHLGFHNSLIVNYDKTFEN